MKAETGQVRVWTPGCASGEETYSLAILFHEEFAKQGKSVNLKIFASDVDPVSIKAASRGCYQADQLENVPPESKNTFFTKTEKGFTVISELRRSIVFTEHNLMTAVPFTRLNLVVCRNLLIYLQTTAQRKAFSLFHFALKTDGYLWLGPSESLGDLEGEFSPVDKFWRIYQKHRDSSFVKNFGLDLHAKRIGMTRPAKATPETRSEAWESRTKDNELLRIYDFALAKFTPPGFLVDQKFRLIHTFEGGLRFANLKVGRSSSDLLDLIHEDLKASLSGALQQCAAQGKTVIYQGIGWNGEDQNSTINIQVDPYTDSQSGEVSYLATFHENESLGVKEEARDEETFVYMPSDNSELENELRATRENLQATVEELETSNEELQATNEELVASNEEMQSSNEELQSMNEELDTVNGEYQKKIQELTEVTDDTNNLLAATDIGVVFLDAEFNIRKFTPQITEIFRIISNDIGRDIRSFSHPLNYEGFHEDLDLVRRDDRKIEKEVSFEQDKRLLLQITPYQAIGEREGLVISVVDITQFRESEERISDLSDLVESSNDAIIGLSFSGRITSWNQGAETLYGYTRAEAEDQSALDLIVPPNQSAAFMSALDSVSQGEDVGAQEVIRRTKAGLQLTVSQRLSSSTKSRSNKTQVSSIERDFTNEAVLRKDRNRLASVLEETSDFVGISGVEGEVLFVNPAGLQLAGLDPNTKTSDLNVAAFHSREVMKALNGEALPAAVKDGFWRGLNEILRPDGTSVSVSQVIICHKSATGQPEFFSTIMRDLTQERKDKALIDDARSRNTQLSTTLAGVVKSFPEMLIVVNRSGKVELASPEASAFIQDFGEGTLPLGLDVIADQAMETDESFMPNDFNGVSEVEIKGGDIRSYLSRVSVLHDDETTVCGAIITIIDVTEFRMLDDLKTSLIGTVSHELKNPVAGIAMTLSLAMDGSLGDLTSTQKKVFSSALRECDRVAGTIKGLLDLTRFDEGKHAMEFVDTDPLRIVDTTVENHRTMAESKGITLSISVSDSRPRIRCDFERITMVCDNLLSNAIKHSPPNAIVLVTAEPAEGGGVTFSVTDSGPGINEEYRDGIFTKFFKAPGNQKAGSGLGLNIAKQFVEGHGGEIWFENNSEGGCTFAFRIPESLDISDSND